MKQDKHAGKSAPQAVRSLAPGWDVLVLVCKACRKRSSGPSGPKAKALAAEMRQAGKEHRLKVRSVQTTCMGLCPRDATAVVVAQRQEAAHTVAWPSRAQPHEAAELLAGTGQAHR